MIETVLPLGLALKELIHMTEWEKCLAGLPRYRLFRFEATRQTTLSRICTLNL